MSVIATMLWAASQPALAKAGDCGWVHGRYAVYNGAGIHRIWMIGTTHLLGLDIADESIPQPLQSLFDSKKFRPFDDVIFGDFYVCAVEARIKGHKQRAHLERVKNIRVISY